MAGKLCRLEFGLPGRRSVRPLTVWSSSAGPLSVAAPSMHAMSTHWPSPVRVRWNKAASRAMAIMYPPVWSM